MRRFLFLVIIIYRTRHRRATPASIHRREACRERMWVVDESRLGSRQMLATCVVGGQIHRLGSVPGLQGFLTTKIVAHISFVIGNEIRPPKKPRLTRLIDFIKTGWPSLWIKVPGVWPDFSPVKIASARIDGNTVRVAVAHDVDFRATLTPILGKQITIRNGNTPIGQRRHSQDLPAQIIHVGRTLLSIPRRASFLFITWAESIGGKGVGIIPDGSI